MHDIYDTLILKLQNERTKNGKKKQEIIPMATSSMMWQCLLEFFQLNSPMKKNTFSSWFLVLKIRIHQKKNAYHFSIFPCFVPIQCWIRKIQYLISSRERLETHKICISINCLFNSFRQLKMKMVMEWNPLFWSGWHFAGIWLGYFVSLLAMWLNISSVAISQ